MTASGPKTTGRFQASAPPQRCLASAYWSPANGESEPAKSLLPARKSLIPAPDPLGVYSTVRPGQAFWYASSNRLTALLCALEPLPVKIFSPPHSTVATLA